MSLVSISQVADMLGSQALALAQKLLPNGMRDGAEWRCGSLAGERGQSLAVRLTGSKAGVWCDFTTEETGDALDLVAQILFAGDKRQALAWARQWLGLESGDPSHLVTIRREAQLRVDKADEEAEQTRKSAHRLWLNAQERVAGTPVEYYLAGRGIDLAQLGRQPRAIRFHPALFNVETQARLPAMVTMVTGPDGQFMATHRTWLEQAGPNDWRKARLQKKKMVLGRYTGGMMRLWRGASGKPMRLAPVGEIVDVTEGIEDALSVAMAFPEDRVVAAISLSNLGNLVFPPAIKTLRVWRQNDTSAAAIAQFDRAVQAHLARGMEVLIPPMPDGVKDVNELLGCVG